MAPVDCVDSAVEQDEFAPPAFLPPVQPPLPWKLIGTGKIVCTNEAAAEDMPSSAIQGATRNKLEEARCSALIKLEEGQVMECLKGDTLMDRKEHEEAKNLDEVVESECCDGMSTLMIKHIPCGCSRQDVIDAIVSVGYGDKYEFFYLPVRRGHSGNSGYAFVGFGRSDLTEGFVAAMTGYRFPGRRSTKACAIAPARIQNFRVPTRIAKHCPDLVISV